MTEPTDDPDATQRVEPGLASGGASKHEPTLAFAREDLDATQRRKARVRAAALFSGVAVAGALVGGLVVGASGLASTPPPRQTAAPGQQQAPKGRPNGVQQVAGGVVSAQNGELTLTEADGQQVTEHTAARTKVRGKGKNAVSDLRPGDHVTARIGKNSQVLAVVVN